MSLPYRAEQLRDKYEVEEVCRRIAERSGDKFPDCTAWLESACQRLGEEAFWSASIAFDLGDQSRCRTYLDYAVARCPNLIRSSRWWRFRAKRLLGPRLWGEVSPFVDRLRGLPERAHAQWTPPQEGQQVGWWPEPAL